MHLDATAILVAVLHHGEHGAIARALTPHDGLQPGYVRGGRSRAMRPILQPANIVLGDWRARTGEQLAALTVELVHSRATLHREPLAAAAVTRTDVAAGFSRKTVRFYFETEMRFLYIRSVYFFLV